MGGPPTFERAYASYRANQVRIQTTRKGISYLGGIEGKISLDVFDYHLVMLLQIEKCLEDIQQLEKQSDTNAGIQWLKGQAQYRQGNYEESAKVYEQLIKDEVDDPSPEALANLTAAYAGCGRCTDTDQDMNALDAMTKKAIIAGVESGSYELLFNQSCSAFKNGRPMDAMKLLEKTKETCSSIMAQEGASEAEADEEISVFLLQKAVVYHKLGFFEDASTLYAQVQDKTSDDSINSVASANNSLVGGRHAWYEALKQVDHLLNTSSIVQRLTTEQVKQLELNRVILLLQLNKREQCRQHAKDLQCKYPESSMPFLVYGLLGQQRKRRGHTNVDAQDDTLHFDPATQKNWGVWERDMAYIYLAEKHRKAGKWDEASQCLSRLSPQRYHQASVLAALVFQKLRLERSSPAHEENFLKKMMDTSRHAYSGGQLSSVDFQEILKVGIIAQLEWNNFTVTCELCQELDMLAQEAGDTGNRAFAEACQFSAFLKDPQKSVEELNNLFSNFCVSSRQSQSELDAVSDSDSLLQEQLPWMADRTSKRASRESSKQGTSKPAVVPVTAPVKKVGKNYRTQAARERRRRQRQRRRERHIQKLKAARVSDNVPLASPDPERWIPRLERSYNRARRKKKGKKYENKGGAQGAGGSEDAKIAASLDARAQAEQQSSQPVQPKSKPRGKKGRRRK